MSVKPPPPSQPETARTLYFPISGNPIGFNHFAAAEWILHSEPELERVTFILSNGRHPDPTKSDAGVGPQQRLAVCEAAREAVADPARSLLARRAESAGWDLRIGAERMDISTLEFGFDRAVRTAELIPLLRGEIASSTARLPWFAGSDLVRRMANPEIFSDADLAALSAGCRYHVLERAGEGLEANLGQLRQSRGVELSHRAHALNEIPGWLSPFLALSSTLIRHAAEAGDPLQGMLPEPAAEQVVREGWYDNPPPAVKLVDEQGRQIGTHSALRLELERLQGALAEQTATLAKRMEALREAGAGRTLAVLETTTGGLITAALAGRSGASRFFRQSRFAYDEHAKTTLLGSAVPGESSVSREAVEAMAQAMRREAQSDFALAESGMAGPPDGSRRSLKYGLCWMACAGPDGVVSKSVQANPWLTRREHQLRFAHHALTLLNGQIHQQGA